jgi:EpsI family protein
MSTSTASLTTPRWAETQKIPLVERLREGWADPASRVCLIAAIPCAALLALLFAENLRHFAYTWSTDENYSHGFLVPILSLYFANEAARRGGVALRGGLGWGLALTALAIVGKLATIVVPVGIVGDLSFLLGLIGLVGILGGSAVLRRYAFPLLFLVFMVPLPIALYTRIASPLQLLVSQVAAALLNVIDIPVLRQGNMMTLPGGVQMFVAEACSGMRQMTGFLALSTAVAFLSPRPAWARVLIVASSLPIAMLANVIRVVVTGVIMYRIDPRYAAGTFHTVEGLLMMGLGLLMLGGFCWLLGAIAPPGGSAGAGEGAGTATVSGDVAIRGTRVAARCVAASAALLAGVSTATVVHHATETPRLPLERPLASISLELGSWQGRDLEVDPAVLRESQADDYVSRTYEDPGQPGRSVTLWINYSRHGLNLRHSPEVCLPSGGWEKVESGTRVEPIPAPGDPAMRMTRLVYKQGEFVQEIGFWYYVFGEGRVERLVRALPITSRSSHGRATRGSGLTVEIFAPGDQDPDSPHLVAFARELLAALEPLLPAERAAYHHP